MKGLYHNPIPQKTRLLYRNILYDIKRRKMNDGSYQWMNKLAYEMLATLADRQQITI